MKYMIANQQTGVGMYLFISVPGYITIQLPIAKLTFGRRVRT
jgi:hypothetical protein